MPYHTPLLQCKYQCLNQIKNCYCYNHKLNIGSFFVHFYTTPNFSTQILYKEKAKSHALDTLSYIVFSSELIRTYLYLNSLNLCLLHLYKNLFRVTWRNADP